MDDPAPHAPARAPIGASASGVRWYPFLVERRANSLLSSESSSLDSATVVVCSDLPNGGKSFAAFETYLHLYGWLFSKLEPAQRCCYEVIRSGQSHKLYIDVDLKRGPETPPVAEVEASVAALGAAAAEAVGGAVHMVFSSCSRDKLSYHVVVPDVALASHEAARVACETARRLAGPALGAVDAAIDAAVYKSVQQFRINGCQKFGSGRVKEFRQDLSTYDPALAAGAGTRMPERLRVFMASLLTELSGARPIEPDSPAGREIAARAAAKAALTAARRARAPDTEANSLSPAEAQDCLDLVCSALVGRERCGSAPFKLRTDFDDYDPDPDTGAVLVPLERTAPSWCSSCAREHEHDHPYLIVRDRTAVFMCRRAARGAGVSVDLPRAPAPEPPRLTAQALRAATPPVPAAVPKTKIKASAHPSRRSTDPSRSSVVSMDIMASLDIGRGGYSVNTAPAPRLPAGALLPAALRA